MKTCFLFLGSVACGFVALGASTVVDIPFWGQTTPPTNRTATVAAAYAVPAGTDYRVKTVATSAPHSFTTGAPGLTIIVR